MARSAVIIGAGITGSLVAHNLVRAGWRVTVLEAATIGAGSSSRTAAGIRQQFSTPETVMGMRYSVDYYRTFPSHVQGSSVPIVQNGYLFLLAMQEEVDAAVARVAMQRRCGLNDVEFLDGTALSTRFPWVDRHAVLAATWCPSDGFLHPSVVYNDAMADAVRLGATLVQHAAVISAKHQSGRITEVQTNKGWFGADLFIDATNAWSPRLAQTLGGTPLPIAPLKRYLWFAERAGSMSGPELGRMPLTIGPNGAYCRPENQDSMLMGWAHDALPEPEFSYDDQDRIEPDYFHKSGPESKAFEAWGTLAEVIPALGEFAGITATTSGYYATTPDHNPFMGFDPACPNLLRLAGFSGHGAMFGPFTARVAELLADAGCDVPSVSLLGQDVSLDTFRIGRVYRHAERLVI